jgi:hypothetical protein
MLNYSQTYLWRIGYNDSVGNTGYNQVLSFTVEDIFAPTVEIAANQNTTNPEYNQSVLTTIQVSEPSDAAGLDTVWINYTLDNWGTYTVVNITETQSFTFTDSMLNYSLTYRWIISYNDSIGNTGYSQELSFTVRDSFIPSVENAAYQNTTNPEYNQSVLTTIQVSEPPDAAGLGTIWINYTFNNWVTFIVMNITETQSFTFTDSMLNHSLTYQWIIGYNDSIGNTGYSQALSFTVEDSFAPIVEIEANQNTTIPEYNQSVLTTIQVSEPSDAAGLENVWINYTLDGWVTYTVVNITETQSFTFSDSMLNYSQTYLWRIGYNDSIGNTGYSQALLFTVVDSFAPTVEIAANQNATNPEYNQSVLTTIQVSEPSDAAGLDTVWINYTLDNWATYTVVNITETQSFTFTDSILNYSLTYQWIIGFNDSFRNAGFSNEFWFTVEDSFAPTVEIIANQNTTIPEYNESVQVSIWVSEPPDAAGLDTVWINYTLDTWATFTLVNITETQSFTFMDSMLNYSLTYQWTIGYNDSIGNMGYSQELSFIVVDSFTPAVDLAASQNATNPEYNQSVMAIINVSEPSDAAGLDTVWINYTLDDWGTYAVVNITETQSFTFTDSMLNHSLIYQWTIGYNDSFGNTGFSNEFWFTVEDSFAPTVEVAASQNTTNPEYNQSVQTTIKVSESSDAAGLDTVWINYTLDDWATFTVVNITETQSFTFTNLMLNYSQTYRWIIGYNDSIGNTGYSQALSFIVGDSFTPTVEIIASQNTTIPEYNESVQVLIWVSEPPDAAGLDSVWINYTLNDWVTFFVVNITETQSFIFTDSMLNYSLTYKWKIGYNDSVGNTGYSQELQFTVKDSFIPTVEIVANQNTTTPEYNQSVLTTIQVSEPSDAAGLDTVWINYTLDDWTTFTLVNITETQSFTFIESMLNFSQNYQWKIGFNDSIGNKGYSQEFSFTIKDSFIPTVEVAANQNTTTPEYNQSVLTTIQVSEPSDAAGLDTVWINYTTNDWVTFNVVNITDTQSFAFMDTILNYSLTYQWTIGYNDSYGNTGFSNEFLFTVLDSFAPTVEIPASQNSTYPKYNETVLASIQVSEPADAAGLDTVWANFTTNNWGSFTIVNITETQSFSFTDSMLNFSLTYQWIIGFNDSYGNTGFSNEFWFTVLDSFAPTVEIPASQNSTYPEYNESVLTTITVSEPQDAAGLDSVWINYTLDDWTTFTLVNITETQFFTFTDSMLNYSLTYKWRIGFNDSFGNTGYNPELSFTVVDSFIPTAEIAANQNSTNPEYNHSVLTTITVSEPPDAAGLDTVWINYTLDDWTTFTLVNITETQFFIFTDSMLNYSLTYQWRIGYNDSVGNTGFSQELQFTVKDSFTPTVKIAANQNGTTPEYNQSVLVTIKVSEPPDAAGLNNVWINYTLDDWATFTVVNITDTQSFIFTDSMLNYGLAYQWIIGYNDSYGNTGFSNEFLFTVVDSFTPTVEVVANQNSTNPEYNQSVLATIQVNEPADAAGLDTVWINYTLDDWTTFTIVNITNTQYFTFMEIMLNYSLTYQWTIGYNDSYGNTGFSNEFLFTVVDSFAPTVEVVANQNSTNPEYNQSILTTIQVSEPADAAGLDTVWINYTLDDWTTFTLVNITETQSFIFTDLMLNYSLTYQWRIGYNDSFGNTGYNPELSFTVVDSFVPTAVMAANQNSTDPEYNQSVLASIQVYEPPDAARIDTVWINYTLNNWTDSNFVNITSTQAFIFSSEILEYNQTYQWVIGYNDTAGNTAYSEELSFIVIDSYAPTVIVAANQTTSTPEFNGTVTASIRVNEPSDASGLKKMWIHYTSNNWFSYSVTDITLAQSFIFTEEMLEHNQFYQWFIRYIDIEDNTEDSKELNFSVVDTYAPDITIAPTQSTTSPEYNDTVIVSIGVDEPGDAVGLDTVWINYTTDDWVTLTVVNITETQSFTFIESMLNFSQNYQWKIGFNDTINNRGFSQIFSFIVIDSYAPDEITAPYQTTSTPEFNGTVDVSITVSEPSDASEVNTVWINYTRDDWINSTVMNITSTQSFTFTAEILNYSEIIKWIIGYNDSVGNTAFTQELSFTIIDSYAPDVIIEASQTTSTPEFNGSVIASIQVSETPDASGINTVWINYTLDNWATFSITDITGTQAFTFSASILNYSQIYQWIIGFNDTIGNTAFSQELSFTVIDSYAPDVIIEASQTTSTPEFNGSVTASIQVTEPSDASGIDAVWINYTLNNWITNSVVNINSTQNHIFTNLMLEYDQKYHWIISYNDTLGNTASSNEFIFDVVDSYAPDIIKAANQTTSTPEYDENNTVSVTIREPLDSSGIDTILLKYRIDSGIWIEVNVTATSNFTFTEDMLNYAQVYDWFFLFNDTAGNSEQTSTISFTVTDKTALEYSDLSQTSATPVYNGSNTVSVVVSDPGNGSGIDTILLYYRINSGLWITVNVTDTSNYTFTPDMFFYGEIYTWYFWFNDTAGNNDQSTFESFIVSDSYIPEVEEAASQTKTILEYNETVITSINVTEPDDASGLDTVWINYTINNWDTYTVVNISQTQNFTFNHTIISSGQIYHWIIGYNDTVGNIDFSEEFLFTVIDSYAPDVDEAATQSKSNPEYNETVEISISVSEPINAARIDTIWLNYTTNDWITFTIVNITNTQEYTFVSAMLKYDQIYQWIIGYNDTAGNTGYSNELTFLVIDSFAPDVITPASQTTATPEFNGSVVASIQIDEPDNASGLNNAWIHYSTNNWITYTVADITPTQSFTFTEGMLEYDELYQWKIGYNDLEGNTKYSEELSFIVIDSYAPDVDLTAAQTNSFPEFNDTVIAFISVSEPSDAAGLDTVWINYTTDDWTTLSIVNITSTQSFTFTEGMMEYSQTYKWIIGFNDTLSNTAFSQEFIFTVIDSYAPEVLIPATQSTSNPEYNDTVTASIQVNETSDAAGLDTVWLNYTIDNWVTKVVKNITGTQSYTFPKGLLEYEQTYQWMIGYNDTIGNTAYSTEFVFTVTDSFAPDIITSASQNSSSPEYNESVLVFIQVTEPEDASGMDRVWIEYSKDNWDSFIVVNISQTQNFTFTSSILEFGQLYEWMIGFRDAAGNTKYSPELSFTVIDSFAPDVIVGANQDTNTPEFNGSVVASVNVMDPSDASGVDMVWINYSADHLLQECYNMVRFTIGKLVLMIQQGISLLVKNYHLMLVIAFLLMLKPPLVKLHPLLNITALLMFPSL